MFKAALFVSFFRTPSKPAMMWLLSRRGVSSLPRTMRAWQTESFDTPMQLREVPVPMITKPDQVLVRVKVREISRFQGRCLVTGGILRSWLLVDFSFTHTTIIVGEGVCLSNQVVHFEFFQT